AEGGSAFGWSKRNPEPGSMRDGDWLVGWGCATACYPSQMAPAAARVTLNRQGKVQVGIAVHEIGNGAYTVVGQMAAQRLGVPLDAVTVALGDSDLPPGPIAGGSNSTASACNVVMLTCDKIRDKLLKSAVTANDGVLAGQDVATLQLVGGRIVNSAGAGE